MSHLSNKAGLAKSGASGQGEDNSDPISWEVTEVCPVNPFFRPVMWRGHKAWEGRAGHLLRSPRSQPCRSAAGDRARLAEVEGRAAGKVERGCREG